jgi:small subunit ribosomal protein S18
VLLKKEKRKKKVLKVRKRKRGCLFCADKMPQIDYKDLGRLKVFMTERSKMVASRSTGVCAKHQRLLAGAIKRARQVGLLPYTVE